MSQGHSVLSQTLGLGWRGNKYRPGLLSFREIPAVLISSVVRLGQVERRKWEKGHRRGRRGQKCKVKAALGLPRSPSREERTHTAYLKTGGI